MSKHHHQTRAEQIDNKAHTVAPVQYDKISRQENESIKSRFTQGKGAVEDSSIQLLAYQIYKNEGVSALEKWLEAEQILMNNDMSALNFTDVGHRNNKN